MKNITPSFLFVSLLFTAINIYSQSNSINKFHDTLLIENYSSRKNNQVAEAKLFSPTNILDSAIVTKIYGAKERHKYRCDDNGNMTFNLIEIWDGLEWRADQQKTYTYDANGVRTLYLAELWKDSNWVNLERYTYTHNPEGKLITQTI